jgi:uncharacterized membrane protein
MNEENAVLAELRRHWDLWLLIAAAVVGTAIATYLTIQHYNEKVSLLCSDSGVVNCGLVTTSTYSFVPGTKLPITIPGLLFFVASGALAVLALRAARQRELEPAWLRPLHLLLASGGALFVIYLIWAEVKLHSICLWCTAVHVLTIITFLVVVWRFQRRDDPLPALTDDAAPQEVARPRKAPPRALTHRQRQAI